MEPIKIEDLLGYRFISSLEASPKGGYIAYTVTIQNQAKNEYKKELHLSKLPLGKPEKVKIKDFKSFGCWKDEATIVVATNKKDGVRLVEASLEDTSVQTEVLNIAGGLNFVKALDTVKDSYLVSLDIDLNRPEGGYSKDDEDYIKVDEIPFWDNGAGYVSRKRNQLFIVTGGEAKLITDKFCSVDNATVAGDNIFYIGETYDAILKNRPGLYRYTISTGRTTTVIAEGTHRIGKLVYTEGKVIYTATECLNFGGGEKQDFYLLDPHNLNSSLLLENDFTIGTNVATDCRFGGGSPVATIKGGIVYLSTRGYCCDVYYLGVDGEHRALTNCGGSIDMVTVAGDRIYTVAMIKQRLQDIYEILAGGEMIRKTTFNLSATRGRYVAKPKYCGFKNRHGDKIDGWVLLPENFDPNAKYPAILSMHGGPCVAWGTIFQHEMQMFASAGYVVMFTNPHGSDGRGAEFADLREKYGHIDYTDFMDFTDHVLKKYKAIDSSRLAVMGGSYGGYMTNWIIGNTNRFAVAVSQRSFCNPISDFGVSCIGYTFDKEQFGGTPWDDLQKLWDHAPLKYAPNATTPTLFIHSLEDYNCPLTEGFQMFTALKYHGVPSKMFLFKGENHELSRSGKPTHRARRLSEMKDWIDSYINK